MKFMNLLLLAFVAVLVTGNMHAMEEEEIKKSVVACIDTGVVMPNADKDKMINAIKEEIKYALKNVFRWSITQEETPSLFSLKTLLANHPTILVHAFSIVSDAIAIAKETRGISNIIGQLAQKNDYFGQLTREEQESVIKIAVNPMWQQGVAQQIQTIRDKGFSVIGFTNRDEYELNVCIQILQQLGIDLNSQFDAFVTLNCWDTKSNVVNDFYTQSDRHVICKNQFPESSFVNGLKHVAGKFGATDLVVMPQKSDHVDVMHKQYPNVVTVQPHDFDTMRKNLLVQYGKQLQQLSKQRVEGSGLD